GKGDALRSVKTRAWDNIAIADICKTIAGEHGLTAKVASKYATGNPPAIGAPINHLDQNNESDLNFLTRLAHDYGAICKPVRDYLLWVEKGTNISATGRVLDSVSITPDQVTTWRATLADRGKYVAAIAHYHDHDTAKRIPVRIGSASGVPITSAVGTFTDEQAASAAATAKLAAVNRGATTLHMTMPGNALIAAGSPLMLGGFRAGVDGGYISDMVAHELSGGGYKTTLTGSSKTSRK
ncbi:MAG: contractile injection system protein, VgrG/Pvc8 family, partial [Mariprofundaceae bacterium]|nr:contractile injection system protein, VgrG/Pvc8 family [Mariprofundaceae bacterium]